MTRIEGWADVDRMEREDIADVIKHRGTTLKQYRATNTGEMDGFTAVGVDKNLRFLRNVRGRIDRKDRVYQYHRDDHTRTVEQLILATVQHKDVKIDDALDLEGVRYIVTAVSTIGQSFTEAECRVDEQ